jgi:hypothetical protein
MSDKSFDLAERKRNQRKSHRVFCQVIDDGEHCILDPLPDGAGPVFRIHKQYVDGADDAISTSSSLGAEVVGVHVQDNAPVTRVESGRFDPFAFNLGSEALIRTLSVGDWSWASLQPLFDTTGCSVAGCPFHRPAQEQPGIFYCALNLSDCVLRAGYAMPTATNVNYCPHGRARNADGMARIVRAQNGGSIDHSGWADRPSWNGVVFFSGGPSLSGATGHIDLYDGSSKSALHAQYADATTVWFWQLGA